jgi:DNA-binding protein HU-beta
MYVDRSQLIEALAAHYEGNRQAAAKALDSVVDTITREVSKGERVVITGFGAFEKAIRPARTVRDPATGEPVPGEETAVPRFHPGANLKAVVAGVRSLPALTLATAAHAAAAVTETAARAAGLGARKSPEEPGTVPDASDDAVTPGSAPPAKAKGRSAAAPAARKPPVKKSPAAKKPPAGKSSPRQAGLDPAKSTASFAPPALAEELHSGQATQATAAAATAQPAPPPTAPKAPVKRAPARKAAAKVAPSKKAAATAPAEAAARKAAAKKTAPKQTAAKTATAKKTATKSSTTTATKKAGSKKAGTKKPERSSAEFTDGPAEPSLPTALAEPPPPDTSSRPVLSLGPDTATETGPETIEATGPADIAQPGRS